jgi:hypothetical protein
MPSISLHSCHIIIHTHIGQCLDSGLQKQQKEAQKVGYFMHADWQVGIQYSPFSNKTPLTAQIQKYMASMKNLW